MAISNLVKTVLVSGLLLGAGYYVRHHAAAGAIGWKIAAGILTALWAGRVLYSLTRKYKTLKHKAGGTISLNNIDQVGAAALPDWLLGYYETEKKIYRYAWRLLRLAPWAEQDGYATRVPRRNAIHAIVLSTLVAALAVCGAGAVRAWLGSGAGALIIIGVIAVLGLYLMAWIGGDWRAAREVRHQFGNDALDLRLGVRSAVVLPLHLIARCAVTADADHALTLAAGASTNVLIELSAPQALVVTRFGYPVTLSCARIALNLVEPDQFVEQWRRVARAGASATDCVGC